MPTKIEWAEETWNPVTGCTPISEGCANCYAKRMSKRLAGRCGYPQDDPFKITLHPDKLDQPLRWKKPRMVFVCSMGDLFHEDVDEGFICRIFDIISICEQHTFLILTKRPDRMADFFKRCIHGRWKNLWLGVTAENQARADERIPMLLQIPAAKRFVSVEPMLGPMDLEIWGQYEHPDNEGYGVDAIKCLDWIICGGETGPGARPMRPDWVRSLRDQCQAAGTPFFFKSWGDWVAPSQMPYATYRNILDYGGGIGISDVPCRVGKKRSGCLLDGQKWNQYPEVRS